jgi:hypothetical protein
MDWHPEAARNSGKAWVHCGRMDQWPFIAGETAIGIRDAPDDDTRLHWTLQLLDHITAAAEGVRRALIEEAPPTTGDARWGRLPGRIGRVPRLPIRPPITLKMPDV